MPSSLDIDNFKYFCIREEVTRVGVLGHSLVLGIERFFDYIIVFPETEETI